MYLMRLIEPWTRPPIRRNVALATGRGEALAEYRRLEYESLIDENKKLYLQDPAFQSFSIHQYGHNPIEPADPLTFRKDSKGNILVEVASEIPYGGSLAERKKSWVQKIMNQTTIPQLDSSCLKEPSFKDSIYFRFPLYVINRIKECILFGSLITAFWFLITNILTVFQDFWDYFYLFWASVIVYIGLIYFLLLMGGIYELIYVQIWYSNILKKREEIYKFRKVRDARTQVKLHFPNIATQFMKISKKFKKFYNREKQIDYSLVYH